MAAHPAPAQDMTWLERFHAGERAVLEECYRDHFRVVETAVGRVLRGANKETVIHDVFLELLAREELRRGFTGGSFPAWLATIAHHQAIDFWRRYKRERSLDELASNGNHVEPVEPLESFERSVEVTLLVDRFRSEALPAKWAPVFEARFVLGLDQRSAAARLGVHRTTLAYREIQIRRLLRRFLLGRGKKR